MLRFLTIIAIMNCCSLAAEEAAELEEDVVIDSSYAEYDGKRIALNGNVTVEHDLGTINANNVELVPQTVENKLRFHNILMMGDVKIALKDGGLLTCAKADVNYHTKEGQFYGDADHEYVIYTENCKDKSGNAVPLIVKSHQMSVLIGREDVKSVKPQSQPQPSHSCISKITAEGNVTVNYNNDFIAASDHGNYQRKVEEGSTTNEILPGLIFLRAATEGGICQVTNRKGDLIKSSHICIDTVKRHILFAYPQGALQYSEPTPKTNATIPNTDSTTDTTTQTATSEPSKRIDFSSDILTWDDQNNVLTLSEHVIVNQQGIGTLTTDKKLQLFQHTLNGKQQLRAIESEGPTVLKFADKEKELAHTLTCYGKAVVDHEHLKTTMDSPRDEHGAVINGQQVFFQDDMGEIFADHLTIYYTVLNNAATPVKLVLEGHVRILNHGAVDPEKTKAFLEYALADIVEYSPQAKEITLTALKKKRVLFFDRINNLQVSAPALKIRRDQTTKKELIQGTGDVRFSFVKRELEEMKKQFQLEKILGGDKAKTTQNAPAANEGSK